ncbi:MAG: ABC-2 transporter permease [Oscillospiraceae bacterium]|nr:ABC-2 transporter permease [Oscillospiraceae bacterium]
MKGLLYKDLLMVAKYCRSFLLVIAIFVAALLVEPGNTFYMVYTCLFVGMVPMTLISYDERDKWSHFSGILPVSRGMLVSVKYLTGLLFQLGVLILSGAAWFVGLRRTGSFTAAEYLSTLVVLMSVSLLAPALLLPCIFKLGVEKGRMAYYAIIVILGAVAGIAAYAELDLSAIALSDWGVGGIFFICAGLFALSWLLSIRIYENKEL